MQRAQICPVSNQAGVREGAQTMYTHVSKYKNDKRKGQKKKKRIPGPCQMEWRLQ
jgi:hypothetical protein